MARNRLSPEDARLWGQVAATVRPLAGRGAQTAAGAKSTALPSPSTPPAAALRINFDRKVEVEGLVRAKPRLAKEPKQVLGVARTSPSTALGNTVSSRVQNTLDASWDKRLTGGRAQPDWTIDLHGHTLASAHAMLNRLLGDAIVNGARLVLLVTGRPARDNPRMPPTRRGVIRASVEDWLRVGPHAARIAAIRNAHPRHGGAGALYLVLRRDRTG